MVKRSSYVFTFLVCTLRLRVFLIPLVFVQSNTTYTILSAAAKLGALTSTYPYQVIRSRLQNHAANHVYPNVRMCIRKTWQDEGYRGFYRGLGTNLVRVLPGTCITFVAYENVAWLLRMTAIQRDRGIIVRE